MYDRNKEIREAIAAGERALMSLHNAKSDLNDARGWGIADMLGGGFITGMFKHARIDRASQRVNEAKMDLQQFEHELRDIRDLQYIDINIDGFLKFADFFFDGFLADMLVQSRINDARAKIDEAINRVDDLLETLKSQL